MALSIEDQTQIVDFRQRVLSGAQVTAEEYRKIIALIRSKRASKVQEESVMKPKKSAKSVAPIDLEALFAKK